MRVLIVDDNRTTLKLLGEIVSRIAGCDPVTFADPVAALAAAEALDFDLALVDYMMPDANGVDVVRQLRASDRHAAIPIIMITTSNEKQTRLDALVAGATDFLTKPVEPIELKARFTNLLALRRAQLDLADRAAWLAREVDHATRELRDREQEIIWRLARAIEYRDDGTGGHIHRMAEICRLVAEGMGLDPETCRMIYLAAPLHDVGKIGIPDAVLGKPGRLSPAEFTMMQEHVAIGERILQNGSSELIRMAERIAATHHEKWDGSGYPRGLAGEAIPIEGRIAAIADVFEGLTAHRVYKPAWPPEQARDHITANRGIHFDPACVDAFLSRWDDIAVLLAERPPAAAVA